MCAEPIGEEHQHVVDVVGRGLLCTCRPCYLLFTDRGRRTALPRRARPLPVVAGLRPRRRPVGRAARSRSGWRSSSTTRCRPARSPSTPARPGPPSPSCRWAPGTGSSTRTRCSARSAPTSRRCWSGCRTGRGRGWRPTWCRSTAATSWSALLRTAWRGFDGGQEARALLDAFFADLAARGAPGADGGAVMPELTFAVVDIAPEPYAVVPNLLARLRVEETTGEQVHALALRAQVRIEPQRRRYDDAEERALLDLFGDRTRFAADAQAVPRGCTPRPSRRGSPAACEIDLRAAVHLRLRRLGHHVPARAARRRGPAAVPVQRHRLLPRRHRLLRHAGAVGPRGALPDAGRRLARPDGGALPGHRVGADAAATPSRRSPTTGTSAASPAGTTPSTRCWGRSSVVEPS